MHTLILLILITLFYSAYNLLVKVSSSQIGSVSTPPIVATIFLQSSALMISVIYFLYLSRQHPSLALPAKAYIWAIAGGICIGIAEILYFYLFRGFSDDSPVAASSAIPFVVGGTIVIAVVVSHFIFREALNSGQWLGIALALLGIVVLAVNSR